MDFITFVRGGIRAREKLEFGPTTSTTPSATKDYNIPDRGH
jgi:hypothetical protein